MMRVAEAEKIIMERLIPPVTTQVPLEECNGMVLAETVTADRDFPPFTRVAMDGYAIAWEWWEKGLRSFVVEGVQPAGQPQKQMTRDNGAFEVMTGAVLPIGTDTVIRYEDCTLQNNEVTVQTENIKPYQNAHAQGSDRKKGEAIIPAGTVISGAEMAVMATVGLTHVLVNTLPEVAIVSSGDELIPVSGIPEPHQVRRSNAYSIKALLDSIKIPSCDYHLPDDREQIATQLAGIFSRHRVVLISGGVSMGRYDFIPEVLATMGIRQQFHKVEQRPGKPFWFGTGEQNTVFAFPGNPVSSFVCALRYFMPWVKKSTGRPVAETFAILGEDFHFRPGLTFFLQVKIENRQGTLFAIPVPGKGSGDLANLVYADGFLELPAENNEFRKGTAYPVWFFRE